MLLGVLELVVVCGLAWAGAALRGLAERGGGGDADDESARGSNGLAATEGEEEED